MATNTTRLGLIKPDLTDNVDIDEINSNMDDIDGAVGAAVVTSTTRPAVPFDGQLIYETDTGLSLVWDGTSWESAGGSGGATISATAPSNPQPGDLWLDTTSALMYVYYDDGSSAQWVAAVGGTVPEQGKIIDVKHVSKTDTFTASSLASGSNIEVTGLSITHTLQDASNKLIITAYFGTAAHSVGLGEVAIAVHDGTGLIGVGESAGSKSRVGAGGPVSGTAGNFVTTMPSVTFVHSPGSGSKTYSVRAVNVATTSATVYVNRKENDPDAANSVRAISSLILQEVAA